MRTENKRALRWFLAVGIVLGINVRSLPMALDWNALNRKINHGSDASIDDVFPVTYVFWCKFHTLAGLGDVLLSKGNDTPTIQGEIDGRLHLRWNRATDTLLYTAVADLVTDKWFFIVAVFDPDNSPAAAVYIGDLTTVPVEPSYVISIDGSGTPTDNSSASLFIGSETGFNPESPDWDVAFFSMWNGVLTLDQITAQWMWPHVRTDGDALVFSHYIHTGATQPDWSGNGNHGTVESGIIMADHVPLPPITF